MQNSGWHGTSVQAVQPLPSLSIQSEATSMDQIESHISHQCRETDSHQSSLSVHWKRSCWILHMWSQADQNEMLLLPMTSYGWCMNDGTLTVTVEWDTEANIKAIKERVDVLTKGCKCATGCTTNRCSCKKKGKKCSAGCECTNCCSHIDSSSNELHEIAIEEEHTNLIPCW